MFDRRILAFGVVLALAGAHAAAQDGESPSEEITADEPKSLFEGWTGSVALGFNGATGNTERFNIRGEIAGTRDTKRMTTTAKSYYTYATDDGTASESRFFLGARNDWKLENDRWFVFGEGSAEFDDFQDWDWRLAGAGGGGYHFIRNEKTTLSGRIGAGLSKKIGGDDTAIRPEALVGADLAHQLTERQKITAGATLYPDLSDAGEFRLVSNAAWEILVDPEVNMSLRLGVEDRYDTMPGDGFKKNDFSYFAMLVWEF